MFKKLLPLLYIVLFMIGAKADAQPVCGFDRLHRQLLATTPEYEKKVAANEIAIQKIIMQKSGNVSGPLKRPVGQGANLVYEIPVVIHVIHTGGAIGTNYNPSDAQLTGMINYLNQSFAATWPVYSAVGNGGTAVPFRFVLAQRSPACVATTGIERINGTTLTGYSTNGVRAQTLTGVRDSSLKALSLWPPNQYYNIWIVNKIDGQDGYPGTNGAFIAGYALFAGGPVYRDGTVMLASQAAAGSKTLPHEMGHAFNLYHTFEGASGSTCPPNNNCNTDGDLICDTEPVNEDGFFNCPTGNNPCTGLPWQGEEKNFMHYTSCAEQRFTQGQSDRMVAALLVGRSGLNTSAALTPPPAVLMTAAGCTPAAIGNPGNNAGMGPAAVKLKTLDDTSGTYTASQHFYEDNTCNLGTNLILNQVDTLYISTGTNMQVARAYIDFNDDGAFSASETVLNSTTPSGLPGNNYVHKAGIAIPATAVQNKPLRLRVQADFINNNALAACSDPDYGQTKDYFVVVQPNVPLSTKIYDEAIKAFDKTIQFSFKAADQQAVKQFWLQRADADMHFTALQKLPAKQGTEYAFTDASAQPQNTYWYRIAAEETDGQEYYSRTLSARLAINESVTGLTVYPNPAVHNIELLWPESATKGADVLITELYGRAVKKQHISTPASTSIAVDLPDGVYFVTLITGADRWTQKLVIRK